MQFVIEKIKVNAEILDVVFESVDHLEEMDYGYCGWWRWKT